MMRRYSSHARFLQMGGNALALIAPFVVYLLTLPPGLTWAHDGADGGDLIAAASTLGIPHPPGYPIYTLLARAFLAIPWGDPAHRVALLSATAGAAAAWALYRLCLLLVGNSRWPVALAGALVWSFAPIPWGQAVIAEVYALSGLLAVALLAALLRWRSNGSRCAWRLAWLLLGLGLAHHPLIAACLIPAALWAWERRQLLDWRLGAEAAGLVALGLLFYVYLPIRASAPVAWGAPRTLHGFWWVISAEPYRHFVFGLPLAEWPSRLSAWAGLLVSQFKVWGVALGLWGALSVHERDKNLSWGLLGLFAALSVYAIGYNTTDSYVYLLPALAVFAAWVAAGLADAWRRLTLDRESLSAILLAGAATVLLALPAASLTLHWSSSDISRDTQAKGYVDESLAVLPADAIVLCDGDRQTFALWYARWALLDRFQGEPISVPLLQFDWYRDQVQGRNPDIVIPPTVAPTEAFVSQFAASNPHRAIFLTSHALAGSEVALQPAGPLHKVTAK